MSLVVSADILVFAIVPYTFDLLCSLPLIFFVVRISKPNTYYLALIDLFDQCENSVLAREHDEQQWYGVQQSCAITICHRLQVSINHFGHTLRERL